jgi:small-conductance mechanosensitive channel
VRRKDDPATPPLATSTAERLAAIVEAAERAAVTVIDDAEAQARRQLEQAQVEADRLVSDRLASLADLTDSLAVQAEAIRGQSERLVASLEEARHRLAPERPPGAPERRQSEEPSRPSHLTAVDPVEEPAAVEPTALRPRGAEAGTAAGARLLATQMAVSGSSREEIAARLRNGFDIEDTASILDAILGPEEQG